MCVERLAELEGELDQMQQRELKDWLVFSGPAVPRLTRAGGGRGEDASRLLHAMVKQLMDFNMDLQQIAELHREERQIRVRFSTVGAGSDRYLLIRNRTRLRGTGLYIRERLTPMRQRIYSELMQLKWSNKISTVFTKDGTVFVVVGQRDRPRPVRSDVALERLSRQLADSTSGGQRGSPRLREQHSGRPAEAAGHGRESLELAAPVPDPDGDASGAAEHSGSPPDRAPCGAGRSVDREQHLSAGRPAERERRLSAGRPAERERRLSAGRPAERESGVSAGRPTDGGGTVTGAGPPRRALTPTSGGWTSAGLAGAGAGFAGVDPAPGLMPSLEDRGGGGGGGGCRVVVAEQSSTPATMNRPARVAAGVRRRRFGGDIRQYAVHSKCD